MLAILKSGRMASRGKSILRIMAVGGESLTMWKKKMCLGHEEHIWIWYHCKKFGFSSKDNEQPLEGFKQKSDVIWFMFFGFCCFFPKSLVAWMENNLDMN